MKEKAQQLQDEGYQGVVFIDPCGREVATMHDLLPLLPEYFDPLTEIHLESSVSRITDFTSIPDQVWQTGSWPAWDEHGLEDRISVPSVFSLGNSFYIARTADPVALSPAGRYLVNVDPLVFQVSSGGMLANADLFPHIYDVARSDYLLKLQARALRKYPPISFELLRAARLDASTVEIVDGRKLRGQIPGASVLRARFYPDLDMIPFDFLLGEDEGRLFISHLPFRVTSLRDAYKSLCPFSRSELKDAVRQGEWWFFPAEDEDIGKHGRPDGRYERSSDVKVKPLTKKERKDAALNNSEYVGTPEHGFKTTYGGKLARIVPDSEHFAREVVVTPEGFVFVRGWVKHVRHDHEPVSLNGWHVVIPNGQVSAWSAPAAKRLPR